MSEVICTVVTLCALLYNIVTVTVFLWICVENKVKF